MRWQSQWRGWCSHKVASEEWWHPAEDRLGPLQAQSADCRILREQGQDQRGEQGRELLLWPCFLSSSGFCLDWTGCVFGCFKYPQTKSEQPMAARQRWWQRFPMCPKELNVNPRSRTREHVTQVFDHKWFFGLLFLDTFHIEYPSRKMFYEFPENSEKKKTNET